MVIIPLAAHDVEEISDGGTTTWPTSGIEKCHFLTA